jgi:hypothetical protein
MNGFESVGFAWVFFTSALGHVAVVYGAYRSIRATLNAASTWAGEQERLVLRGHVEERRDVVEASRVRAAVEAQ